jgi:hypothetical protein
MEEIIKQIEEYQQTNKKMYDFAMAKPINEIVYDFSTLIGHMNGELSYIKLNIELLLIKEKYK